ncbi:hypothetical protein [Cellulomonas alba]|uniref:Uncharacterized protein n=1 Tax=Cellulomonas alba TaxID=3053467 RepID=A0ABT7SCC1_9CELL|nr:hypothetical protein [Cellulomonas alba]MDM7853837.1 hypothetical protein [Cellulomonas alba]
MSEYDQSGRAGTGGAGSSAQAAAQTAKDEARDVAGTAKDAGQRVANQAKESASEVAHEAQDQLRGLWDQTRGEVSGQAASQQSRLADGMRTFSGDLHTMAQSADGGVAAEVVRRVAEQSGRLGDWLAERGPGEVLDEVRAFARRRPGTFLLVAAGAGVLVGRLSRALKDSSSQGSSGHGPSTQRSSWGQRSAATTSTGNGLRPEPVYDETRQATGTAQPGATPPPAFPPTSAGPAPASAPAFPPTPTGPATGEVL